MTDQVDIDAELALVDQRLARAERAASPPPSSASSSVAPVPVAQEPNPRFTYIDHHGQAIHAPLYPLERPTKDQDGHIWTHVTLYHGHGILVRFTQQETRTP